MLCCFSQDLFERIKNFKKMPKNKDEILTIIQQCIEDAAK